MAIKTWIHWIGGNQKQTVHEIVELFSQQGIEVQGFDGCRSRGPGVIFTGEVTPAICEQLRELSRSGQIPVLACCHTAIPGDTAWRLMEAGASDVLVCQECGAAIHEITARLQRWEAVDRMVNSPAVQDVLVGESQALKAILRQVVEAAHFTDASVLILGESGTGKELLAKLVHALDPRPDKGDLVMLDCSTIMSELSGSEFFGHERGAFTGAVSVRDGAFAVADGATLFLDEIAELPLALQAQLLRVIQEHTFKRVGGNAWQQTAFRLVCATNLDLRKQVERGVFRADLYYRIASFVCHLPPLRERPEDILPLAYHFLKQSGRDREAPALDSPVQEYLFRREYPGNVRDLKQVVIRMLGRYAGQGAITVGCIPPDDRPARTEDWDPWWGRGLRACHPRGLGSRRGSQDHQPGEREDSDPDRGG